MSAEPLEAISPGNPPEAVVAAQLQAFRCVVFSSWRMDAIRVVNRPCSSCG
jgi:hypothetical protein